MGVYGIAGYLVYKYVLPQLKDFQWPVFQPPPFPEIQFSTPQAPQAPAPQQQQQAPSAPQEEEEEEPQQQQQAQPATATTTPPPPPSGGSVIYDSTKGWSGVSTAASGNPKWTTEAGGVGRLTCGAGHCRVYIAVKNYNARMEGEFMVSGAVRNLSLRLRSRHQEGGSCENRFGGFGAAIHPKTGEVEFQTESCHNLHENSISGKIAPLSAGWHKFAFSCYDGPDKSVNFKLDVDGKTVLTGKHPSPKPSFVNKTQLMQKSYIWLRSNNDGSGNIAFRNFRVIDLGGSGTTTAQIRNQMIYEPYLFNGYYARRRL